MMKQIKNMIISTNKTHQMGGQTFHNNHLKKIEMLEVCLLKMYITQQIKKK